MRLLPFCLMLNAELRRRLHQQPGVGDGLVALLTRAETSFPDPFARVLDVAQFFLVAQELDVVQSFEESLVGSVHRIVDLARTRAERGDAGLLGVVHLGLQFGFAARKQVLDFPKLVIRQVGHSNSFATCLWRKFAHQRKSPCQHSSTREEVLDAGCHALPYGPLISIPWRAWKTRKVLFVVPGAASLLGRSRFELGSFRRRDRQEYDRCTARFARQAGRRNVGITRTQHMLVE